MNDLSYEQRKEALIEEITAAFMEFHVKGGVSLSESRVIDDYGSKYERSKARRQDTDKRWQDVTDKNLCKGFIGYICLLFMVTLDFAITCQPA